MAFSTLQNTFTPTLVESTAEQELLKKKWHQETRFFLASENEEWILLEKPVNLETRHYMCHSFWLTRAVFLRGLGLLCCSVFAGALNQNVGLIGERGISPAMDVYNAVWQEKGVTWIKAIRKLGFFALIPPGDAAIRNAAILSSAASLMLVIRGACNAIIMALMWATQMSFICVGQHWYSNKKLTDEPGSSMGGDWDRLFAHLLFWSTFLLPILSLHQRPQGTPPPKFSLLSSRLFLFHIAWNTFRSILRITWTSFPFLFTLSLHSDYRWAAVSPLDWYLQIIAPKYRRRFCATVLAVDVFASGTIVVSPYVQLRRIAGVLHLGVQLGLFSISNEPMFTGMSLLLGIFAFDDYCFRYFFSETTLRRLPLQYRSETICSPWFSFRRLFDASASEFQNNRRDPHGVFIKHNNDRNGLKSRRYRRFAPSAPWISGVKSCTPASLSEDDAYTKLLHMDRYLDLSLDERSTPRFHTNTTAKPTEVDNSSLPLSSSAVLEQKRISCRDAQQTTRRPAPQRERGLGTSWQPNQILQTHEASTIQFLSSGSISWESLSGGSSCSGSIEVTLFCFIGSWCTILLTSCLSMQSETYFFFFSVIISVLYGCLLAFISSTLAKPPLILLSEFPSGSLSSKTIPVIYAIGYGFLGIFIKWIIDAKLSFLLLIITLLSALAVVIALLLIGCFRSSTSSCFTCNRWFRFIPSNWCWSSYVTWAHLAGTHGLREIIVGYLVVSGVFLCFSSTSTPQRPTTDKYFTLLPSEPVTSRYEIVVEGSSADPSRLMTHAISWVPLKFKCGIESLSRAPCVPLPYVYRLDYALGRLANNVTTDNVNKTWLPAFLCSLLKNELSVVSLLRRMRFHTRGAAPLKVLRVRRFLFQLTPWGGNVTAFSGPWWTYKHIETLIPPVMLDPLTKNKCVPVG